MRKRSALLLSALTATISAKLLAQAAPPPARPGEPETPPKAPAAAPAPAPRAPAEGRPAEPKPGAAPTAPPAPGPGPAPAAAPTVPPSAGSPPAEPPPGDDEQPADSEPLDDVPSTRPADTLAPASPITPLPVWPEPERDAAQLKRQGAERPTAKRPSESPIFAEDWWTHARPIVQLHGLLRARGELFYKFHLGRFDAPENALWPRPADHYYRTTGDEARGPRLCTPDELGTGAEAGFDDATEGCDDNTNAGANLRFRLDPELHVSDNLRVITQIDLLDNVVLGSTPGGYGVDANGVRPRSGYASRGALESETNPPSAGQNSLRDSIVVKRVWAEWETPVGQLRFGRMPHHWGLGMLYNSGDGHDDDYQSTIDRAQIVSGFKSLDLYASAALDYPNEGPTSDTLSIERGQPYDIAQLDDITQYVLTLSRVKSPELKRLALSRGEVVLSGGLHVLHRSQRLAVDQSGPCSSVDSPAGLRCAPDAQLAYVRRGASMWVPDLWLQLLYEGFRFEAELATVQGSIDNVSVQAGVSGDAERDYKLSQWGLVTEIEQRLAENRLALGFKFGWSSGDADVDSLTPGTAGASGIQDQNGDKTISTFRFHPSYSLDLILYRNLLSRVQGTYYLRPSIRYDFMREPNGAKIGGGLAAIWSRASEFMQTPGHERDLGIELNGQLYFQSKDGALNDDPDRIGGFFAKLEYGVLFPMAGLGYASNEAAQLIQARRDPDAADTSIAQILRLYLGVAF